MMEAIISEKGLDFNVLEKEIFRIGCEFAAGLMEQVLTNMLGQYAEQGPSQKRP